MDGLRSFSLRRIAIVLLMVVAWLALTNHCLLGAACTSPVAKDCPMHMKSSDKAPPKQNGAGSPCCKTLRAVVVAKLSASANTLDFILQKYFTDTASPESSEARRCLIALDTGPPGALSFSESVLQRSILAHAPPR